MALTKIPYNQLSPLLEAHLSKDEDEKTDNLIRQLLPARRRGYLTPAELEAICRWKSPRAIKLIRSNKPWLIRRVTQQALSTRSERQRLSKLLTLKGVSVPMASAILMVLDPSRYGVIDIRVWQLLYAVGAVTKKASGVGFDFNNWYQFLMIIRYLSKKFHVTSRDIERTLFLVHKQYQSGRLYLGKSRKRSIGN